MSQQNVPEQVAPVEAEAVQPEETQPEVVVMKAPTFREPVAPEVVAPPVAPPPVAAPPFIPPPVVSLPAVALNPSFPGVQAFRETRDALNGAKAQRNLSHAHVAEIEAELGLANAASFRDDEFVAEKETEDKAAARALRDGLSTYIGD